MTAHVAIRQFTSIIEDPLAEVTCREVWGVTTRTPGSEWYPDAKFQEVPEGHPYATKWWHLQ